MYNSSHSQSPEDLVAPNYSWGLNHWGLNYEESIPDVRRLLRVKLLRINFLRIDRRHLLFHSFRRPTAGASQSPGSKETRTWANRRETRGERYQARACG